MKKLIILLVVLFSVWLTETVSAQGVGQPTTEVAAGFGSIAAIAILVSFIAEGIKIKVHFAKPIYIQLVTWLISLGVSFLGFYLKLGIFIIASPWQTLLIGFACGLIANGFYDTGTVTKFFKLIGFKIK